MAAPLQTLPGFRDFRPEDCAIRNYLFDTCRTVARRYGFAEYETPLLESRALYEKKSGGELSSQLFSFTDQGDREVTLRPEVTASLGRLAAEVQRHYPKPLRWFEIGPCFRYERPQKGRLREFYQFNVDVLGEDSPAADAELLALVIDLFVALGLTEKDFVVRLSSRHDWNAFALQKGLTPEASATLLEVVDKLERDPEEKSAARLAELGLSLAEVRERIANPSELSPELRAVMDNLTARGLERYVEIDFSIVRGLAYYTGLVFEVFDRQRSLRALAGGGRYDQLVHTLTEGKVDLPAVGFAVGDVVLGHLIDETPAAKLKMQQAILTQNACDLYLLIADEEQRPQALALLTELRRAGLRVTYSLTPTKINKQFKLADASGARFALIVGSEYPELTLRHLSFRREETLRANADPLAHILQRLAEPDGPALA